MNLESMKKFIKNNIVAIISVILAICSLVGSYIYIYFNKCEECLDCSSEANSNMVQVTEKESDKYVKVDIKGAVKKAGVYSLLKNSTVSDAIESAGGLSSNGVTTNINLSKKIHDEMVIYVFSKNELKEKETSKSIVCELPKCECETIVVDKEICTNASENTSMSNNLVSINTGSLEELITLDGIGESKAKAIIEYRQTNGNFTKIEDIMNVPGIGEKAFLAIKDKITI